MVRVGTLVLFLTLGEMLPPPTILEIKAKINKWDLIKLKKFLHNKENYKQGEKTTFRMGENNSK